MVSQSPARLDRVFHALANDTRRKMLQRLAGGERNLGELAAPFNMTFAGASKHVHVLEAAGLVHRRVEGRTHIFRLEPAALAAADDWLHFYRRFGTEQFDRLEAVLKAGDENASIPK